MHVSVAIMCILSFRLHVLAGVYPGSVDKTDNKLAVLWEETYIRNMKYAAQRLEEVILTVIIIMLITDVLF